MKNNWTMLGMIVVAGVIFAIYGVPWLHSMGRVWVAFVVYAVLVIIFLYARHDTRHVAKPDFRRRARRSPDQL